MAPPITRDRSTMTTVDSLASRWPRPTNAQALAVLDGLAPQWSAASSAIAAGVPSTVETFLAPAGILPRMRLLACGWTKPGDTLRRPQDSAWWGAPYAFPLWNPLRTYASLVGSVAGVEMRPDDDLASGDIAALSQSIVLLVDDAAPVFEAPCPKWLIPPGRGQLPIPNPECLERELRDRVDKIRDKVPGFRKPVASDGLALLIALLAIGYLLTRGNR